MFFPQEPPPCKQPKDIFPNGKRGFLPRNQNKTLTRAHALRPITGWMHPILEVDLEGGSSLDPDGNMSYLIHMNSIQFSHLHYFFIFCAFTRKHQPPIYILHIEINHIGQLVLGRFSGWQYNIQRSATNLRIRITSVMKKIETKKLSNAALGSWDELNMQLLGSRKDAILVCFDAVNIV